MTDGTESTGRSPDEIEREIDRDRGRLAHTAEELQDRLSVGSVVDQVMHRSQERGGDVLRGFGQTLRENPIPIALIGVGLAWLMAGGQRASAYGGRGGRVRIERVNEEIDDEEWLAQQTEGGYGAMSRYRGPRSEHLRPARPGGIPRGGVDWSGEESPSVGERLSGSARSAAERVRDAATGARSSVEEAGDAAYRRAGRLGQGGDGMDRLIEEQPLVAGALALAFGAAIGALLPNTRAEDRMMGEQADDLRDRAADAAAEEGAKVRRVAEAAAGEAGRMADEAAGEASAETPSGREVVETAEERARKAAERVSSAAEEEARRQNLGRSADPGRE